MEDFRLGKSDQQKGGQSDKLLPDVKWRWLNDNFLRSWYFKNQSGELEQADTEEDDDEEAGGEKKTVYGRFRKSFKKLLPEVVSKDLSEDAAEASYTAEEAWQPSELVPEPGDTLEPYLGELSIDHDPSELGLPYETNISDPDIAAPEAAQRLNSQSEMINLPNETTTIAAKMPEEQPRPKQVITQKYHSAKPSGSNKSHKPTPVPEIQLEPYPVPELKPTTPESKPQFIKPIQQEAAPTPAINNLTELKKKVTQLEDEIQNLNNPAPKIESQVTPKEAKSSSRPETTKTAGPEAVEPFQTRKLETPDLKVEKELPRGVYSIKEVFEKVQEAAEKGQPIEALFEKRQEIKDSRRSNENAGWAARVAPKARQAGPANRQEPKQNSDKPTKTGLAAKSAAFFAKDNDSAYKQAVFSGFWTGVVVVLALTVILVTS